MVDWSRWWWVLLRVVACGVFAVVVSLIMSFYLVVAFGPRDWILVFGCVMVVLMFAAGMWGP